MDDVTFYVDRAVANQNCAWLREGRRKNYRNILCQPNHSSGAYYFCEETCGKCSDTCEDTANTFLIDGQAQDCKWLNRRPDKMKEFCYPKYPAFDACPETCGGCD